MLQVIVQVKLLGEKRQSRRNFNDRTVRRHRSEGGHGPLSTDVFTPTYAGRRTGLV